MKTALIIGGSAIVLFAVYKLAQASAVAKISTGTGTGTAVVQGSSGGGTGTSGGINQPSWQVLQRRQGRAVQDLRRDEEHRHTGGPALTTNEGLVIGGVVVGGGILIYMMSQSSAKLKASSSTTGLASIGGLLSGAGSFLNGLIGGGSAPKSYSSISTPNSNVSSPISSDASGFGITPGEQANVDSYDNQGGEVFGIAGIDY